MEQLFEELFELYRDFWHEYLHKNLHIWYEYFFCLAKLSGFTKAIQSTYYILSYI